MRGLICGDVFPVCFDVEGDTGGPALDAQKYSGIQGVVKVLSAQFGKVLQRALDRLLAHWPLAEFA